MLGLIVADQRVADGFDGGFAAHISILGEVIGIAFASYDGADDRMRSVNDVLQSKSVERLRCGKEADQ
ncbi:hypothetical protein, partial [Burkholderia sp. Bp8986]|uniref:hypothetical protein n=1 Tax=Burkholderia sp. Bp8986 TaxID=2184550 RepID=UPI0021AB8BD9